MLFATHFGVPTTHSYRERSKTFSVRHGGRVCPTPVTVEDERQKRLRYDKMRKSIYVIPTLEMDLRPKIILPCG